MTARQTSQTTKTKKKTLEPRDSDDLVLRIRERAYELFQQRGGEHGHDLDDWLKAEAEIRKRK